MGLLLLVRWSPLCLFIHFISVGTGSIESTKKGIARRGKKIRLEQTEKAIYIGFTAAQRDVQPTATAAAAAEGSLFPGDNSHPMSFAKSDYVRDQQRQEKGECFFIIIIIA